MKLTYATPQDGAELNHFYRQFPRKGLFDFLISRGPHFFRFYEAQSSDSITYLLRGDNNEIEAMASFVLKDTFYDGKPTRIAVATDLRVSSNRKAIIEWSKHFLPVMHELKTENKIDHFFSQLNLTETSVLNTFVRPRQIRRPMPRYYLYRKFFLNSLHGQFPWANKPLPYVMIQNGHGPNQDALIDYIVQRSQFRPFSSTYSKANLLAKMDRMQNMDFSKFLVAKDIQGNILGCLAPWSSAGISDYIPLQYQMRAHNFRQFLKFGKLFGWTRPLTKPVSSTGIESPLKFHYLTNIFVDHEDVFECLLYAAYNAVPKDHFLVYAQIDQDYRTRAPKGWVSSRLPYALYSMLEPHETLPSFLHPNNNLNPEIEAAFI